MWSTEKKIQLQLHYVFFALYVVVHGTSKEGGGGEGRDWLHADEVPCRPVLYYKQHYDEADMWYRKVLQQLPKTHTPVRTCTCTRVYCEDCWVQSCHCLFEKSIALLCPAHICFELNFVSISMAIICDFLVTNNSTIRHDTTELIAPFHSESTAHSNDINISYYEKISKIGENPLIIDLAFHQNFAIFAMCSKH